MTSEERTAAKAAQQREAQRQARRDGCRRSADEMIADFANPHPAIMGYLAEAERAGPGPDRTAVHEGGN